MDKSREIDRDMLVLLLVVLGAGMLLGFMLAPKGKGTASVRNETKNNRGGLNLVFGNVVIGSNNGEQNAMSFGMDDSSETRE
jgi:hypothetical protein